MIEPVRKCLKEFTTPDEFSVWYVKHTKEVDGQATHLLNKKYQITGYWITRIQGSIALKSARKKHVSKASCPEGLSGHSPHHGGCAPEGLSERTSEATHTMELIRELTERVTKLEALYNELVDHIEVRQAEPCVRGLCSRTYALISVC